MIENEAATESPYTDDKIPLDLTGFCILGETPGAWAGVEVVVLEREFVVPQGAPLCVTRPRWEKGRLVRTTPLQAEDGVPLRGVLELEEYDDGLTVLRHRESSTSVDSSVSAVGRKIPYAWQKGWGEPGVQAVPRAAVAGVDYQPITRPGALSRSAAYLDGEEVKVLPNPNRREWRYVVSHAIVGYQHSGGQERAEAAALVWIPPFNPNSMLPSQKLLQSLGQRAYGIVAGGIWDYVREWKGIKEASIVPPGVRTVIEAAVVAAAVAWISGLVLPEPSSWHWSELWRLWAALSAAVIWGLWISRRRWRGWLWWEVIKRCKYLLKKHWPELYVKRLVKLSDKETRLRDKQSEVYKRLAVWLDSGALPKEKFVGMMNWAELPIHDLRARVERYQSNPSAEGWPL